MDLFFSNMSKGNRPTCIGMVGEEEGCVNCSWHEECERMTQQLEADVYRGGTHLRLTGKYKEKKYKPKKIP